MSLFIYIIQCSLISFLIDVNKLDGNMLDARKVDFNHFLIFVIRVYENNLK